ncbi:50S ribosomal protein L20, partial [Bacillus pumilus]|uniref:50S ribosomal protein L20 n=1 Tax=Bacillus pumilus TaxID=1408 RepID=UPI0011A31543
MPTLKPPTLSPHPPKNLLKLPKPYFPSKHTLYKLPNQQLIKSPNYAFPDRPHKKRHFPKLSITPINPPARMNGLSYSRLIHGLNLS